MRVMKINARGGVSPERLRCMDVLRRHARRGCFAAEMFVLTAFAGCMAKRCAFYPEKVGEEIPIKTLYRYRLAELNPKYWPDLEQYAPDNRPLEKKRREGVFQSLWREMKANYPEVFSEDGIPIVVDTANDRLVNRSGCLLGIATLGIFPIWNQTEHQKDYTVSSLRDDETKTTFDMVEHFDSEGNLFPLPWGLFFYWGEPEEMPGRKRFYFHGGCLAGEGLRLRCRAMAYAVAANLMKMEAEGKVDGPRLRAIERQIKLQKAGVPQELAGPSTYAPSATYAILRCERESGSNFVYRFELELTGEDKSLRAFRAVQREFREAVKEDYLETFPSARASTLVVDFTEYRLVDGRLEGRAVVLTLRVVSLDYDAATRCGSMSVKIAASQYAEARRWIRENIETLARDKNIALVTGECPPTSKFYLGDETFDEATCTLKIEFKTE